MEARRLPPFPGEPIENPMVRFGRDLARLLKEVKFKVTGRDVRVLVDLYYELQEYRKAAHNQRRSAGDEPVEGIEWACLVFEKIEKNIKRVLSEWTLSDPASVWARSIDGIDTVIAAGLRAYIDMNIATNPSKIWRLAGLDPSVKFIGRVGAVKLMAEISPGKRPNWDAVIEEAARRTNRKAELLRKSALSYGEGKLSREAIIKALAKRPYNLKFKVLAWKIGHTFTLRSKSGLSYYGSLYRQWKNVEEAKNERKEFAEQAREASETRNLTANQKTYYSDDKLPPGRIDLRAARKATKLFLSHWWEVAYRQKHGCKPPRPWIIEHGGHTDFVSAEEVLSQEASYRKELGDVAENEEVQD